MQQRTRALLASGFIGVIFLLVQLGSLALVEPFQQAGYQAVEDPQDPTNSLVYVAAILVMTVFMLLVFRYDVELLIRALIVFASVYLSWYVFSVVVPPVATYQGVNVLAVAAALALGIALYAYPEWYVIDASGIVMGAGAAGLFGISFGLLPALILLTVLAVYDAISVYGTEHMLTLASGVMDLKVPVVLVVPLTLSYSFLSSDTPDPTDDGDGAAANGGEDLAETDEHDESDEESAADDIEADPMDRDALFIGLGDAVIPTVLVASAAFFSPESVPSLGVPGLALTLPALMAMIGTLVGLAVLLRMVLKGRAHAGLPLLNGGAITGYLIGALASGIPLLEAIGLATYL
ncbi:presenilin family intramembrane aspartyl protease PSH [Halorientalis salina]|uniref:presenilin family intramembrane aspartyl protease PSH n=1 Tax=Halorientalis salina TaxID=2932266 RepID=UPI0010ABF1FD|nr:presenilin family intramembrane aspartyl protease PSH [Halorientalis salina]